LIKSTDINLESSKNPLLKRVYRVIFALIGITIFGGVAGYVFQERLVGTPGDFINAIKFVFRFTWPVYLGYLILVTFLMSLPFMLLSSFRPNKAIAYTGLLAYLLGETIKAQDFTRYVAGNIPASYDAAGNTPAPSIVAAAFSYMLAFMFLLAVESVVRRDGAKQRLRRSVVMLPFFVVPIVTVLLAGAPLFKQQQRDRNTQYFARSETITSQVLIRYIIKRLKMPMDLVRPKICSA
jgi:hypothetical protein